jgi:hypothetical protein
MSTRTANRAKQGNKQQTITRRRKPQVVKAAQKSKTVNLAVKAQKVNSVQFSGKGLITGLYVRKSVLALLDSGQKTVAALHRAGRAVGHRLAVPDARRDRQAQPRHHRQVEPASAASAQWQDGDQGHRQRLVTTSCQQCWRLASYCPAACRARMIQQRSVALC